MIRITSRIMRGFSQHFKLPTTTSDISNMIGYINASDKPTLSFFEKLSHFSPPSLYNGLDEFTRQFLFTLTHDYHLGLPAAVIIISLILRGVFLYANFYIVTQTSRAKSQPSKWRNLSPTWKNLNKKPGWRRWLETWLWWRVQGSSWSRCKRKKELTISMLFWMCYKFHLWSPGFCPFVMLQLCPKCFLQSHRAFCGCQTSQHTTLISSSQWFRLFYHPTQSLCRLASRML